ncbi:hypothetical protein PAXINDRAFT_8603 [Paxillus involutus ATCC 200175]|nr:hypothetical protein PAXINDRAFT_8603 [Paxillus involutus ATCC 200175]
MSTSSQLVALLNAYENKVGLSSPRLPGLPTESPSAQLGQPEINLGVIPGGGGTQRLARLIGKSRAMEMILTGRIVGADEAERWGLVSRVVREESGVVHAAVTMAKEIASKGRVAVVAGKEAVNAAFEVSLAEGLRFERRLFHSLFATKDQKEVQQFVFISRIPFLDPAPVGKTKREQRWVHRTFNPSHRLYQQGAMNHSTIELYPDELALAGHGGLTRGGNSSAEQSSAICSDLFDPQTKQNCRGSRSFAVWWPRNTREDAHSSNTVKHAISRIITDAAQLISSIEGVGTFRRGHSAPVIGTFQMPQGPQ